MPVLYANRAFSTLASSITNVATSLSVAAGQGARFPAITAPDYFYATLDDNAGNVEIVKVTARSTDTFTIVRAQDGTSALAFNAGAGVELRVVKAMLDDFKTDTRTGYAPLNGTGATGTWGISITGNAATATALQTARTIGGVSFNGTANINLPGVNTAGNQNTTGSAATLTTTRTLWGQNFNGSANVSGNLTSVGNITGSAGVTLTATSAQLTLEATGANSVSVWTNGVERLRAYSGGGVLINETIYVGRTNTTNEGGQINLQRASDNASMYALDVYGSTATPTLRLLNVANSDALLAEVDSSGNVAITGGVRAASYNGGQLAGMRNKIINGKMEIAQRGTSFTTNVSSGYTLDRFYWSQGTTAVGTVTQSTDVPSGNEFQNSIRYTVTTADTSIAAGDYFMLGQHIEGYNARDLIGRTFTLSFWVRSPVTGTHCVAMLNSGADRTYVATYTVNAANTWEYKSVTVSGGLITAGTWNWTNGIGLLLRFAGAAGSTFQTTAGAWQTGNFVGTSAQVNVLGTVGNIFAITGVQLEVGSVATPFEHRPYGLELALCQRYYEVVTAETNGIIAIGQANSTSSALFNIKFSATKRAVPTGLSSGSFIALTSIGGSAGGTLGFAVLAINSARLDITSASGLTAGNATALFANGAPAAVAFSAEL